MVRKDAFDPYLERLRALPFVKDANVMEPAAGRPAAPQADACVVLRTASGETTLAAELKRTHLTREVAARLVHLRTSSPNLILFAPLVGRDLADRFGREQLNFVDLAGNVHLEIGRQYFVHVEGKRPDVPAAGLRALRAPTYQVLFALLVKPDLVAAPARALAEAAGGVSPQTAIDARRRLQEQGHLVGAQKARKWSPGGRKGVLDLFLAGFPSTLAPSLAIGRFRPRQRDLAQMETALAAKLGAITTWRWGGAVASQRLTGYYRGDTTIVYVDRAPARLAADLELVPDRQGPLQLVRRPGPLAFEGPVADAVHPLLAYVDLLMEGDERANDAAREIAERYLHDLAPLLSSPNRGRR